MRIRLSIHLLKRAICCHVGRTTFSLSHSCNIGMPDNKEENLVLAVFNCYTVHIIHV